jgi:hypothetical protein
MTEFVDCFLDHALAMEFRVCRKAVELLAQAVG